MIADKNTNIVYFSDLIKGYSATFSGIKEILDSYQIDYRFLPETRDIWARDYMPLQVFESKFIEYRYDPDYLQGAKKGFRDLKTYPDIVCDALNLKTIKTDLILDGGNIVRSSNCVILTDKVVKENKCLYGRNEIIKKLQDTLEVEKVILIPWDTCEEYGHSDGMLRFIDDNTVLLQGYFEKYRKSFKHKLYDTLALNGIGWEHLKYTVQNEHPNNWAYINFLQTKDLIIVPSLNAFEDEQALNQIKQYYPEYAMKDRIRQVDVSGIVKAGGGMNCITWTVKE